MGINTYVFTEYLNGTYVVPGIVYTHFYFSVENFFVNNAICEGRTGETEVQRQNAVPRTVSEHFYLSDRKIFFNISISEGRCRKGRVVNGTYPVPRIVCANFNFWR